MDVLYVCIIRLYSMYIVLYVFVLYMYVLHVCMYSMYNMYVLYACMYYMYVYIIVHDDTHMYFVLFQNKNTICPTKNIEKY